MALHHNLNHGVCLLCDSKVKTAHPYLRELWPKIKTQFPLTHVSWGFRNAEEQELMVSTGASFAHWPKSDHNKMDSANQPCSRAIDLFSYTEDGAAVWSYWQFKKIWEWIQENDFPVLWGGDWPGKKKDSPHYYLKESIKQP